MRTLIEKEIKYARNVAYKKAVRRNENGLTKREQSKEDNTYLILDSYYIQNFTRKKIAENLRLSIKTVNNYLDRDISVEEKILFLLSKKVKIREIKDKLSVSNKKIYSVKGEQKKQLKALENKEKKKKNTLEMSSGKISIKIEKRTKGEQNLKMENQ